MYCKCQHAFCSRHLFFKNHECTYDYRLHAQKELLKNNPQIEATSGLSRIP